jgi:membrane-associated phospholipid phosphatase
MSRLDGGYTAHERTDHRASFDGGRAISAPSVAGRRSRPAGDGTTGMSRRRGARWIIAIGVATCYGLLALAVHLRMLDSLDIAVRGATHAGEVGGTMRLRANHLVRALSPDHLAVPLLLIGAVACLLRRSLRPFAVMAVVGGLAIFVTLGTKWVMAHTEGNQWPIAHGSFPSGHAVSVIVAFGLAVLLLWPGTRWAWLLPAFMGLLMGGAIVVAAVHPATDVLGAGLLGIAVLGSASAAGLGQWARNRHAKRIG